VGQLLTMLAVYVSGHGFGHATRTAEVLRVVRERAPALAIVVSTSAPGELFEDVVPGPLSLRRVECDVGLVQKDALTIDEPASADAVASFLSGWSTRVASEARWLRAAGARLVLGDIPPLAFAAAAEAGVASLALANFSWDWIHAHLGGRQPRLREAAELAATSYARAGGLLRLPFSAGLTAFRNVEPIPLVARRPALRRAEARRRLRLDGRPSVLLSFGGVGMPGLEPARLAPPAQYQFLLTGAVGGGAAPNVRRLGAADLQGFGLGYCDLVGAVDVVLSKPGYGIVSDCIGAGTRLVYTARGDFPEYDVLVAEMPRYLPTAFVSNADLGAGRLGEALGAVQSLDFPAAPPLDGARVAADRILARL
jgi:hypothetical protein